MAAPSAESIQKSKAYLESQYGIKVNDKQARRYRFIMGDAEGAVVNIQRKIGRSPHQTDHRFVSLMGKSTPGYKKLETQLRKVPEISDHVAAVFRDYEKLVSTPLSKGQTKKAYNGLVEWLDEWVAGEALTRIRGAMYRSASEKLAEAGALDDDLGGDQSDELAKTNDPKWEYECLIEFLKGSNRIGFAKAVAGGSTGEKAIRQKLEGQYHDDELYLECAHSMLNDLLTLDPRGRSDEYLRSLTNWLPYWSTAKGRNYINRAIAQKRYAIRHKTMKVTVYERDKNLLDKVQTENGLRSQSEAFAKVMEFYNQHHS